MGFKTICVGCTKGGCGPGVTAAEACNAKNAQAKKVTMYLAILRVLAVLTVNSTTLDFLSGASKNFSGSHAVK
jgi:hypothetical protein